MRQSLWAVTLYGVSLLACLPQALALSRVASPPPSNLPCSQDTDCPNHICGQDGLCGLLNGAACIASTQCRTICAPDGRCGVPAARYCQSADNCRGNVCNADQSCGVLMGATCTQADACRSGVCQRGTCVVFCAADADCQPGFTYCHATGTQRCAALLANGAACDRGTMCQTLVCGNDHACGAATGEACLTSASCRSGACDGGVCAAGCTTDANCKTGTFCDATTQTCLSVLSAGAPCSRSTMCDGGVCASDNLCGALTGGNCVTPQSCRSLTCSPTYKCASLCASDAACDYTHFCGGTSGNAVCTPRILTGEACTINSQCINGICNTNGICGQVNGGTCADSNNCVGGACQPEDLRCGLVAGSACTKSGECRVGYCNVAGLCASCTQNADCPAGLCNKASGACGVDAAYAGIGLEGGGCTQTGRAGLGVILGAMAVWMGLRWRRGPALFVALLVVGTSHTAQAAGFAVQRYVPTDPGQMQLRVDRPWYAEGHPRLALGLAFDVGHNPVVYTTRFTDKSGVRTAILSKQVNMVVQAAISWTSWLTLSAQLPIVLGETGQTIYGIGPKNPALGTAQVNGTVRLVGQAEHSSVSLHVAVALRAPEGAGSHAHDSGFGAVPRVIVAGRPVPNFGYAATAGVLIRPNAQLLDSSAFVAGNQSGSEFQMGLALNYVDDKLHFSVGPELTVATLLSRGPGGTAANTSLEMLIGGVQAITPHVSYGAAAGLGLFGLLGTPDWRLMAQVSFAPFGTYAAHEAAIEDRDHDGIADNDDACPDTPGEANSDSRAHGCPPDRDADGVVDAQDTCPDIPAGLHPDPKRPGCPLPEHTAQATHAKRADAGADTDVVTEVSPVAIRPMAHTEPAAPAYQPYQGGADDDFAPSGATTYQYQPETEPAPKAQSDMPVVADAPQASGVPADSATAEDTMSPATTTPAAAAAPVVEAPEPPPAGQAPAHSVAHPIAAMPPVAEAAVVLHKHKLSLKTPISFVGRTAKLTPEGQKSLALLAAFLVQHKAFKQVVIDVHTDNAGRPKAMRTLSAKRGVAIKRALIGHRVPPRRIKTRAMGDQHPVASNKTAAGRAQNVRVELNLL